MKHAWLLLLLAACTANRVVPATSPDETSCGAGDYGDDEDEPTTKKDAGAKKDAGKSEPKDDRLYPAEVGRRWTYRLTSTYPSCPAGDKVVEILGKKTVNGRSVFGVRNECGYEGSVSVVGDVVEYVGNGGTWFRQLDEPVDDGHTWETTNGAATFGMKYTQIGKVTVSAGTFDDCWTVTQVVSYQQDWVFCRGVGQVSSRMVDRGGGTIETELLDKNF